MPKIRIAVAGTDEVFTLKVEPPPQIGSQFSAGNRLFRVTKLTVDDQPDSADDVDAEVELVGDA